MKEGSITLLLGRHGCGKSYHAKQMIRATKGVVLVFAPSPEYRPGRGKEAIPGMRNHVSMKSFFAGLRAGGSIGKECIRGSWREFEAFCRFAFNLGNCTVVLEEVTAYLREARSSRAFRDLTDRSRHAGVNVLVIAPTPAALPTFLKAQANTVIAFRATEKNVLKYYRDLCGDEAAAQISKLQKHAHKRIQI